jgi:hypothetical protein
MEMYSGTDRGVVVDGKYYPSLDERIEAHRERDTLEKEITCLAGQLCAATHRFLTLILELERRYQWEGTSECANWLNLRCGLDKHTAREQLRTARALESLPKISEAMQKGQLSYSKVRALTRVACPDTENTFLETALHSTASQIEQLTRKYRTAKEAAELTNDERQRSTRHFKYRYDDDGSLVFRGSVPAETGALLLKALEAALEDVPSLDDVPAGTYKFRSPIVVRRADALGVLAESFATHGPGVLNGGDRNLISVHVSAETLIHKDAGCCAINDDIAIPAETARRLACDASVVAIFENEDGEPLNVGRKTRTISAPLRRLLDARDRGCRYPGCSNTRWLDAHHIKHWANGGETKPSNLVSLCSAHHRKVHEGQVEVHVLDDGAVRFVTPDGKTLDSVAPDYSRAFDWNDVAVGNEARGIDINERTLAGRSDGPMDWDQALWVLCARGVKNSRWGDGVYGVKMSAEAAAETPWMC